MHEKRDLRKNYVYNFTLPYRFWFSWIKGYHPSLQGCKKWRNLQKNHVIGQLVMVCESEDVSSRGSYRLGRVHRLQFQIQQGQKIVSRATVAVIGKAGENLNT